jgi:hypothetical protein
MRSIWNLLMNFDIESTIGRIAGSMKASQFTLL